MNYYNNEKPMDNQMHTGRNGNYSQVRTHTPDMINRGRPIDRRPFINGHPPLHNGNMHKQMSMQSYGPKINRGIVLNDNVPKHISMQQHMSQDTQQAFRHFYLPQYRRQQQKPEFIKYHNTNDVINRNYLYDKHASVKPNNEIENDMRQYMRRIPADKNREFEAPVQQYRKQPQSMMGYNAKMEEGVYSISRKDEEIAVMGFLMLIKDLETTVGIRKTDHTK